MRLHGIVFTFFYLYLEGVRNSTPKGYTITVLLLLDDFPTGTSLSQREMLLFTQGLTGVFQQAGETFTAYSTHTRR
jgi:hypothetical protein